MVKRPEHWLSRRQVRGLVPKGKHNKTEPGPLFESKW
jgi:hypothetical protein